MSDDKYKNTPLAKKLGLADGMRVGVVGRLPYAELPHCDFVRNPRAACDALLWFAEDEGEIRSKIERLAGLAPSFWIFWRKGLKTGLKEQDLRDVALPLGFVDYKVVSFDDTWSGLRFKRRGA